MDCCAEPKQWILRIHQRCPKHNSNFYSHFCTNPDCLEILCSECIPQHQEAHALVKRGQPQICRLVQVEQYFEGRATRELKYEEQKRINYLIKKTDPCIDICEAVDQYFYGSGAIKVQTSKNFTESAKIPTAKRLVQTVEKASEYRMAQKFKERYFQFLDHLLREQ